MTTTTAIKPAATLSERLTELEARVAMIESWPVGQQQTAIMAQFKIDDEQAKRKRAEREAAKVAYLAAAPQRNAAWQRFAQAELVIAEKCQVPTTDVWLTYREWCDAQQLPELEVYQKQDEMICATLPLGRILECPVRNVHNNFVPGLAGVRLVTPYVAKARVDTTPSFHARIGG